MRKRNRITEDEKKVIRGELTRALEETLELYAETNPKRAYDEGYGVFRGFNTFLLITYTTEAYEEFFDEFSCIWEVFRDRLFERLFEEVGLEK